MTQFTLFHYIDVHVVIQGDDLIDK